MCTPEESPHPIGWKKDIVDVSNNDINKEGAQRKEAPQRNRSRSKDRSDKCKRPKNNSSSSSSSSTGSSSSASSQDRDRKKLEKIERKKAKKEAKREAKKIRKEQKRSEKHERKEMKKKEKQLKKMKKQEKRDKKIQDNNGANIAECGPPINLMDNKARAPETKEEWEARQSQIRRVQDPETGRTRLVKGDGEILEEFVSKDRHKEINKQATAEDGAFFQSRTVGWVPNNN